MKKQLAFSNQNPMNKTMKPAGFQPRVAPARPLTKDEKKQKIMQFVQQKREAFAINILCSLCHENGTLHPDTLVDKAVALADALFEKLYPLPEEEKSNQ